MWESSHGLAQAVGLAPAGVDRLCLMPVNAPAGVASVRPLLRESVGWSDLVQAVGLAPAGVDHLDLLPDKAPAGVAASLSLPVA